MPRISVCTNFSEINSPMFSGENDNLDFCSSCYRKASSAAGIAALAAEYSVPEEATESGACAPDYAESGYRCYRCNRSLGSRDNG